jgi:photosystem II stability/assembly factor-like uncharacterized protein
LLPSSPTQPYRFEDASFLDATTGWVVGGLGEVFETDDGGKTWRLRSRIQGSERPVYLRSVIFVTRTHGFVGTLDSSRVLLETTDGGASWTNLSARLKGARVLGICGLNAIGPDTIVGVGWFKGPAAFIKSTDGGQTWTAKSLSDRIGSATDVLFQNGRLGFIAGGSKGTDTDSHAVILSTSDGGKSWTTRFASSERSEWAWKFSSPDSSTLFVSVEGARAAVLKSHDGGETWNEQVVPGSRPLQGIGFASKRLGWVSGRGTSSVSTDGGLTWSPSHLDTHVNRFRFFGDSVGYAMGQRIYKYDRR